MWPENLCNRKKSRHIISQPSELLHCVSQNGKRETKGKGWKGLSRVGASPGLLCTEAFELGRVDTMELILHTATNHNTPLPQTRH